MIAEKKAASVVSPIVPDDRVLHRPPHTARYACLSAGRLATLSPQGGEETVKSYTEQAASDSKRSQVCAGIERSQRRWRLRIALAILLFAITTNGTYLVFAVAASISGRSAPLQFAAASQTPDMTLTRADEQTGPPFSWVPNLLYGIINSPNQNALDALYDAVFAAGPAVVPQLAAAIADDRTAEFAAQSLAFIGGSQAVSALANLVHDSRNLDLRRFYYGALGALETPDDEQILINVIGRANAEPDRAVTDAAIVALTVRSDPSLVATLQKTAARLTDPVIQDDLANATSIIQSRAHYLASQRDQTRPTSIEQAVRTYFIPAIRSASPGATQARGRNHGQNNRSRRPASSASFDIRHVEYGPDHKRALAQVTFEDPQAKARYWIVLQKEGSSWVVDTAWLGTEEERTSAPAAE
jgi:hypothetical protein